MDFKLDLVKYQPNKKIDREKIKEALEKRRLLPAAESSCTAFSIQSLKNTVSGHSRSNRG